MCIEEHAQAIAELLLGVDNPELRHGRLRMTEDMIGELMAVIGIANQTNRFADGYRLPSDAAFET